MGEPEPYDPEQKPDPSAPRPKFERADWLVGADEGLSAEAEDLVPPPRPTSTPRLVRPQLSDADRLSEPRPPFPGRGPAAPLPPPPTPAPDLPTWDAGANSVPKLRRSAPAAATPPAGTPIPELSREFPMDDAEERARVAAALAEQQAAEAALAARPHQVVDPREFEIPTLETPWWGRIPELLRSDRRVQGALLVLLVATLAITLWPREEKTISVAHLKEHADRYADTPVRVGGRVSEVFPVGGSFAYTLVQGRDTIVVFSRVREPKPREKVIVVGTLSTGYLDGQSRVAIFEATR